jgi:hypothetical protein
MEITKELNWRNIFIFLFLIIFPFGQLTRMSFNLAGINVPLLPIDIIVGCGALYAFIEKFRKPKIFGYIAKFLWVAFFSFIFSIFIFKTPLLVYGLFYLIRFVAYSYFLIYVWNFARGKEINRGLLMDSLLAVSIATAIFGWIQYFAVPSLKPFFILGWDEHLFRLVGTFLDPPFIGLIIVFGIIISLNAFIEKRSKKMLIIVVFLLISLAFTYSRGSYLALLAGLGVIGIYKRNLRQILSIVLGLALLIIVLPTSRNHILGIFRAFSVIARIDNYSRTIQIFKISPVFGVGYDNICLAKAKLDGSVNFFYHDCSGSDSSLLLILATTGVIGIMAFCFSVYKIAKSLKRNSYSVILSSSFAALLVHSLFSNSLFYPWILGYIVILLAISVKD